MVWHSRGLVDVCGDLRVPGDKSLSHRALLFAALAEGSSRLQGLSDGADVASSVRCLRQLGVEMVDDAEGVTVRGRGLAAFRPAAEPLDCGNSGTTLRLLAGVVAGCDFSSILTGDASLRHRPMGRIIEPLRAMGAAIAGRDDRAPLTIRGGGLRAVTYRSPVASAQVKSCVLLAGLSAEGTTAVIEAAATRDHTERLLASMGADVRVSDVDGTRRVELTAPAALSPLHGAVPGDISSAAYWLAAALVAPRAHVSIGYVGWNPGRRAIVETLRTWGADIAVSEQGAWHGEPVVSLCVRGGASLSGGRVTGQSVPGLIDELPLLGLLAPFTEEGVEVQGAAELRAKESDRIDTTCAAIRALGGTADEYPDGFHVGGRQVLRGGVVDAAGDHRIALAVAAVSTGIDGRVRIEGAEAATVSYPGFFAQLDHYSREASA